MRCNLFFKRILVLTILFALLLPLPIRVYAETKSILPSGVPTKYLQLRIEDYVNKNKVTTAGMTVAVFDTSEVLYQGNFGYKNRESEALVDEDTVFEWGSVTKLLVWVSAMQLVEQGKLDLDEDIKSYLPKGFLTNLSYEKPVTMINLMNHNAGFQEMLTDLFIKEESDILGLREQLKLHMPTQIYEPGTVTAYSNWGSALAAFIIEEITGMSFDDYVHQYIFDKLGMKHTAIRPDLSDNPWVKERRMELMCYTTTNISMGNMFYHIGLYPAGMCTGTLSDLLLFARALLPEDGKTTPLFQEKETLGKLLSPSFMVGEDNVGINYHGFWYQDAKVQLIGHGGNTAGCSSNLLISKETGIGAVVMTNQAGEMLYNHEMMKELVFGGFDKSPLYDEDKELMEGFFRPARTVRKGPLSLISNLGAYKMSDNDKYIYWQEDRVGDMELYRLPYGDMIKIPKEEFIPLVIFLGLYLLGIVYSSITLVIGGCIVAPIQRRRWKKKEKEVIRFPLRKFNYMSCGFMLILPLSISILIVQISGYVSSISYQWQFVLHGIILLALCLLSLQVIMKWDKTVYKREKIKYIVTIVFSVINIIFIIYHQLYGFWMI